MRYLKYFESSDKYNTPTTQSCIFNDVEYNVGDIVSIDIDKLNNLYADFDKQYNLYQPKQLILKFNLTYNAEYEIIEIIKRRQYGKYNIAIFNDDNGYVQIPIECVYKELESNMVKYNL